jgi:LacI family transcriptional regulator
MRSRPHQRSRRQVALLVETSRAYGRGVLRGISRYVRQNPSWSVRLQDRGLNDPLPNWLSDGRLDGVIARIETPELARTLRQARLPVVNLSAFEPDNRFPLIDTDDIRVAEAAYDHFAERGFRSLAFCGYTGARWSDTRRARFLAKARQSGITCHEFRSSLRPDRSHQRETLALEARGLAQEPQLIDWLRSLPATTGIFAANDLRGRQLLDLCHELGLSVPDHLAVLGVDNDELLCELTDPPLSSIEPDCERIGWKAAETLDRLMSRHAPNPGRQLFPPVGISTRKSTDVLAIAEPLIAQAIGFIREHACDGIGVPDVLRQVPVSRSALERGFRRHLDRPPKAEILRIQLNRAMELLRTTDLPLPEISRLCGFRHPEYFNTLFREKLGLPPGQYRRRQR